MSHRALNIRWFIAPALLAAMLVALALPGVAHAAHGASPGSLHDRVVNAQRRHQRQVEERAAQHPYRASQRHGYRQDRHHGQRHYPHNSHSRHNSHPYASRYSSGYNTVCRRVSKHGYWYNRPAEVGGLQCTNRSGYSYIKPNSRYLIRYY